MNSDCIFCRVARGETDSEVLHQDDQVVAFRDIAPQAPHHVLIIPRRHIATLDELGAADAPLAGHMIHTAARLARDLGVAGEGYRLVLNCNRHGGQTVFHLHLHLLAGRPMRWPPG